VSDFKLTPDDKGLPHPLRAPCKFCGAPEGSEGTIETKNGQDVVHCGRCGRGLYNAPKTETGREPRTLTSIRSISPSQRARLFERAHNRCEFCGRSDSLVIGHSVSVKDGFDNLTDVQLNSDENLLVLCAECNAGWGARTPATWLLSKVLWLRTQPPASDRKPARQEFAAWLEQMRGKVLTDEEIERAQILFTQHGIEAKREVMDEHKREELEAWRKKRREEDS
jgi:hypothetical protein